MILSHQYRFIFLKTMKTAGTSLELCLSEFCGCEDIVTPIAIDDEILRPNRPPRRYLSSQPTLRRVRVDGIIEPRPEAGDFYNHIPAAVARSLVPMSVWDRYYKFSIERNPWDRQVSYFHYRRRGGSDISFDEHLRQREARLHNYEIYSADGRIAVDQILRFERLEEEVKRLFAILGIPGGPRRLFWAKSQYRPRGDDYRSYFDRESRDVVSEWYRREIECLEYEF